MSTQLKLKVLIRNIVYLQITIHYKL
jgi:hypothetical protein